MKTGKTLEIKIKEPFCAIDDLHPTIKPTDIPNIINKILSPTTTERNELISNNGYATVCTHNII